MIDETSSQLGKEPSQQYCAAARGKLSLEELSRCFSSLPYEWVILQTLENYDLFAADQFAPENDIAQSLQGHAFCISGHIHWKDEWWLDEHQHRQHGWRVVYIGDAKYCPEILNSESELEILGEAQTKCILLRGERRTGQDTWIDLRVPRRLDYPWPENEVMPERLGLEMNIFHKNSSLEFIQYTQIIPWKMGGSV